MAVTEEHDRSLRGVLIDLGSVLVVDDSPSDRRLLIELLVEGGAERANTRVAGSLHEARCLLTTARFGCIFLDLTLPDAAGLQGLSILSVAAPDTPIVVVTGHPADDLVYAALAEGADEYVCKDSLSAGALIDAGRRAVGRRRSSAGPKRFIADAGSVLDAIAAPAAAIDGSGRIIAINTAWCAGAATAGADPSSSGVGVNYLTVCDLASGRWAEGAAEAAAGIRSVLRGDSDHFAVDYPCPDGTEERWFTLRVTPLGALGGGAVLTHLDVTSLRLAEDRLRGDDSRVNPGLDGASPIAALVDRNGRIAHASPEVVAEFGVVTGDLLSDFSADRIPARDGELVRRAFRRVSETPGASETIRVRLMDVRTWWREIELTLANFLDDPAIGGVIVTGADITRVRHNQIVRHLEQSLLKALPASVVVTDDAGVVVFWNDAATDIHGVTAAEAIGRSIRDLPNGPVEPGTLQEVTTAVHRFGRWEGEYDTRRSDGAVAPVHAIVEAVTRDSIGFRGVVIAEVDVSERQQLQADLAFQALHDPLTALPNRRLFVDHVEAAVARVGRSRSSVAVLFIDLDDFKAINDSAGHIAGDAVLLAVAELVTGAVREGDVAARFGGDEFVLCCDVADGAEALEVAERILEVLSAPVRCRGRRYRVGASIGIAMSHPGLHAEALIRNADAAMYAAKEAGKSRAWMFDEQVHERARRRVTLGKELRVALERGQLYTCFQPVVDLRTETVVAFEALVRWLHPGRGLIPPDEFIPVAEQDGLVGAVGEHVLRESATALAAWNARRPGSPLTVAVNVSMHQLADAEFPVTVSSILAEAGVASELVCLEMTETAIMDTAEAAEALAALKAAGVRIAIDDFGTGYSSLSRLKRFPVDHLKIDRSFIEGIGINEEDEVIVATVINLAASLGLDVVAEGIETQAQRVRLLELGCTLGQGFLWSPAVRLPETFELL